MKEPYKIDIEKAREERQAPVDYERTAKEFKRLLDKDSEYLRELRKPLQDSKLPEITVFLCLVFIAVLLFLILQGCSTAPLVKIGSTCTDITDKGVLISRPCPSGSK